MRRHVIVFSAAAALSAIAAPPAFSQVVIHDGQPSDSDAVDGNTEFNFLHSWNRHHDNQNRWSGQRSSFGSDDVITLLEDRGYRVRNVQDLGERYLVNATRGSDHLLVSVSRYGDIMGVVHDQN
ncbi:hypothetical protein G6L67_24685 [Agrobacterium tumefaciens]|uniref:PepSY domain-containing protein n=3 Tax=Rhizobium/Agrobacterium group TaxID=227290 RepID=A0A4P8DJN6_RHIRH|nr:MULTISPECIES: hypothetical protein [Rhizobium/Agrobacterium group]ASK48220.1 hypothetical protein [Agrobacterium radiobacter]AYM84831.1 hypothetical protein At12D1_49490 [Agrobacterium tumefaciens]NTE95065.1 hypothetical protein [Agrobacterium tumefaciens]QCL10723.1 hypothetical protein pOC-C5.8_547 [Rhizobium rhizogenes]QCL98403.1 hypothetical protein CFBP7129_29930 [Agrobacterium tumefaciens]